MIGVALAAAAEQAHEASGGGLPQFDSSSFTSQMFWAALSFAILMFLLNKYVLPGIADVLDARSSKIKDDLDSAEKMRKEANAVLADYRTQLAEARQSAGKILDESRLEAARNKDQSIADLNAELSKKKNAALEEIEQAKRKSLAEVQSAAVEIAILATEKLIAKSVQVDDANQMVAESIKAIAAEKDRIH